ncbi:MAG: hypothetical protein BWY86_00739 [Candidatus Aminicenantes bacterium ADurb.Bin508]|nr:MAG: hypothetical protein BWY86_00739 [Candidatus Aminicenantes bacterium ADurb.Bin508]
MFQKVGGRPAEKRFHGLLGDFQGLGDLPLGESLDLLENQDGSLALRQRREEAFHKVMQGRVRIREGGCMFLRVFPGNGLPLFLHRREEGVHGDGPQVGPERKGGIPTGVVLIELEEGLLYDLLDPLAVAYDVPEKVVETGGVLPVEVLKLEPRGRGSRKQTHLVLLLRGVRPPDGSGGSGFLEGEELKKVFQ